MTKTQQTMNQPPARGLEDIAAATGSNLNAYTEATQAMLKGVAAFNDEILAFANTRMEENMKAGQALMQCGHLGGALQLQLDCACGATEQYLVEAGKLAEIATRVTGEYLTPLQSRAREVAEEAEASLEPEQASETRRPAKAEASAKSKEVVAAAE